MTSVYELNDAELDAVCGGALVTINGPFVSFNNSFNFNFILQKATNIALVVGAGGGSIQQVAGLLGSIGSTP